MSTARILHQARVIQLWLAIERLPALEVLVLCVQVRREVLVLCVQVRSVRARVFLGALQSELKLICV